MMCPNCGCWSTVIETREKADGNKRRRRECPECGHRFSTIEQIIGEDGNHAEKNEPVDSAMQRRKKQTRAKPYGLSELRIALRIR